MMDRSFASARVVPGHRRGSASKAGSPGRLQRAWEGASPLQRHLAFAAALLAIGLLATFYSVVSQAVGRAATGRELARVAAEREVVCSAFSTTSSRDLCLLTVAARNEGRATPPQLRGGVEQASWQVSRPVASARVY